MTEPKDKRMLPGVRRAIEGARKQAVKIGDKTGAAEYTRMLGEEISYVTWGMSRPVSKEIMQHAKDALAKLQQLQTQKKCDPALISQYVKTLISGEAWFIVDAFRELCEPSKREILSVADKKELAYAFMSSASPEVALKLFRYAGQPIWLYIDDADRRLLFERIISSRDVDLMRGLREVYIARGGESDITARMINDKIRELYVILNFSSKFNLDFGVLSSFSRQRKLFYFS